MTNLPRDGFQGVNYDFINDEGVPSDFKKEFENLNYEMNKLLAQQRYQTAETQKHIRDLIEWTNIATNAITIIQSLIPLIPTGKIGSQSLSEKDKQHWLTKLSVASLNLGHSPSGLDVNGLTQMLKKLT